MNRARISIYTVEIYYIGAAEFPLRFPCCAPLRMEIPLVGMLSTCDHEFKILTNYLIITHCAFINSEIRETI